MARAKQAIPDGYHTVTPVLTFDDTRKAIEWYEKALGAKRGGVHEGPDGKVAHAEIRIGNSPIMLNDAMMGSKSPKTFGGSPASLWIYVEDCDALFNRALKAGAQEGGMPMADQFWGDRCGMLKDPFGYAWTIATHKEDLTPEELEERSEEFFKAMAGSVPK